jgi:hypothetical protein
MVFRIVCLRTVPKHPAQLQRAQPLSHRGSRDAEPPTADPEKAAARSAARVGGGAGWPARHTPPDPKRNGSGAVDASSMAIARPWDRLAPTSYRIPGSRQALASLASAGRPKCSGPLVTIHGHLISCLADRLEVAFHSSALNLPRDPWNDSSSGWPPTPLGGPLLLLL